MLTEAEIKEIPVYAIENCAKKALAAYKRKQKIEDSNKYMVQKFYESASSFLSTPIQDPFEIFVDTVKLYHFEKDKKLIPYVAAFFEKYKENLEQEDSFPQLFHEELTRKKNELEGKSENKSETKEEGFVLIGENGEELTADLVAAESPKLA